MTLMWREHGGWWFGFGGARPAGLVAGLFVTSCGASPEVAPEAVGGTQQEVQRDVVYVEAPDSARWMTLVRTNSSPIYAAIRHPGGTCGATFVSKHYAITAGHCTGGIPTGSNITVEKIMTTNLKLQEALDASVVSGSSNPGASPPTTIGPPTFSIVDQLIGVDGYAVTSMACTVVHRCLNEAHGFGNRNCPGNTEDIDIALLNCPNRPTPKDWVAVTSGDPISGDIMIYWFHEVLDLQLSQGDSASGNNVPANNWWNYGYLGSLAEDKLDNYHYTGTAGHEPLPLVSSTHANGTAYRLVGGVGTMYAKTDVPTCHGTSGSGTVLVGTSTLIGPVQGGSMSNLCHDFASSVPGTSYTNAIRAPKTRVLEALAVVTTDRL